MSNWKACVRALKGSSGLAMVALLALLALPAAGDEYHYNNLLIGERAFGLGGAYVAVSDDSAGLFYNPAGVAFSSKNNISGSVNALTRTKTRYEAIGEGDLDWDRESESLVPTFFGIVKHTSAGVVGLSFAVTDALLENQDIHLTDLPSDDPDGFILELIVNNNNDETTYNFGPSFAKILAPGLAVGTTLYVHYRKIQWIQNEYTHYSEHDLSWEWTDWYNEYWEVKELGLRPIVGVMWSPEEASYSLGAPISRTFALDSEGSFQQINATFDALGIYEELVELESFDENRVYPWTLALGVAFFPSHSLLFSGDLTYHESIEDAFYGDRRSVLDGAFGMELYLSRQFALRFGLYSSRASTYSPDSGREDQDEHVDLYGATASISRLGKGHALTLGLGYGQGDGKTSLGRFRPEPRWVSDMSMKTLSIFIGASYSY